MYRNEVSREVEAEVTQSSKYQSRMSEDPRLSRRVGYVGRRNALQVVKKGSEVNTACQRQRPLVSIALIGRATWQHGALFSIRKVTRIAKLSGRRQSQLLGHWSVESGEEAWRNR